MADAQVEIIRVYGATPKLPPASDPEIGIEVVTGGTAWMGVADGPIVAGASNIPKPPVGENLGVFGTFALRVVQPGDPATVISNVVFFVSQAALNAVAGAYDGIKLYTPASDQSAADLDLFYATDDANLGEVNKYEQATRTLGAQGYVGDAIEDVYSAITAVEDLLAYPQQPRLVLTGRGREDNTLGTFGKSVNDVSRGFLVQPAVTATAQRGLRPALTVSYRYDELV